MNDDKDNLRISLEEILGVSYILHSNSLSVTFKLLLIQILPLKNEMIWLGRISYSCLCDFYKMESALG
jgi:hypothetical protein